jgi:hypothetical protein
VEAMKKPSRAGGKRAKALPRNALKPRGRNAPKPQSNRRSAADQPEPEVAQLKRELHEALEQQTATSEVLHVISRRHVRDLAILPLDGPQPRPAEVRVSFPLLVELPGGACHVEEIAIASFAPSCRPSTIR